MPSTSRKRTSPGASRRKSQEQQDPLAKLPEDIQQKIHDILKDLEASKSGAKSPDKQAKYMLTRLENDLSLHHVDPDLIRQAITNDEHHLERLISDAYCQTQRAYRVFELLDTSDKGVVVVQDLQRVCVEVEQNLELDDLEEMINQYAEDGLLTKEALVKIARQVGL